MKKPRAPVIAKITPMVPQPQTFPMLPWFPANFMSSTRGWRLIARAIYRELLDCQWEMLALPADPEELQRLIGATKSDWQHWPTVEPKFPIGDDGLRRNPTLEKHRARSIDLSEKHRRGAAVTNAKKNGMRVERFANNGSHDAKR